MEGVRKKNKVSSLLSSLCYGKLPKYAWRDLLIPKLHLQTLGLVAQMSKALKELVEEYRSGNYNVAKRYAMANQGVLALKIYHQCANAGNQKAAYRLFLVFWWGQLGTKIDYFKAEEWCKKIDNEHFMRKTGNTNVSWLYKVKLIIKRMFY